MGSAEIIKVDFQSDKRLKTCFLTYSPAICIKVWKNVTAWSTSILYNVKRKKKKEAFLTSCKLQAPTSITDDPKYISIHYERTQFPSSTPTSIQDPISPSPSIINIAANSVVSQSCE